MSLTNAIIKKLKEEGSIPTVILFSDVDTWPEVPYVCVKPEAGSIPGTRQYRIIAHAAEKQFSVLENYILVELDRLLLGRMSDSEGNYYKLSANGYTDISQEPGDITYFMEQIYYTPMRKAQ